MEYTISTASRRFLDRMLHKFQHNRVLDINGGIQQMSLSDNENETVNLNDQYAKEIKVFLLDNDFAFGSSFGAVINSKGMELKTLGSLAAYEEWETNEEERLRLHIGDKLDVVFHGRMIEHHPFNSYENEKENEIIVNTTILGQISQTIKLTKEISIDTIKKVFNWSLKKLQ